MAPENLLECAQQRSPLLHTRGAKRHPSASPTANPTEVKAEKSERSPWWSLTQERVVAMLSDCSAR
jgi:hypothetical protein